MSVAELKELDDKSLVHRELQLERELMEARFRNKTGQLEDTSKLAKLRKGSHALARSSGSEVKSLNPNALRDMHRSSFVASEAGAGGEGGAGGFLKGIVDKVTPNE